MPDSEAETTAAQSHGVLGILRTGGRMKNQERGKQLVLAAGGLTRSLYKPCPPNQHEEEWNPTQG